MLCNILLLSLLTFSNSYVFRSTLRFRSSKLNVVEVETKISSSTTTKYFRKLKDEKAVDGNMARKIKRALRRIEIAETAEQRLGNYTAFFENKIFDNFLKTEAKGRMYQGLMDDISSMTKKFKIPPNKEFGKKATIILPNIVEMAVKAGTFEKLVAAVGIADLGTLLSTERLTVFAPSDAAFAKIDPAALEALLADKEKLTEVLKYHVYVGTLSSKKLATLKEGVPTAAGKTFTMKLDRQGVVTLAGDVKIVTPDIKCSNGVIHIVDTVLMPK